MRTIVLALLLTSCAAEPAERVYSPAEELWRDAYCHGDLTTPDDQERVERWVKKNGIACT